VLLQRNAQLLSAFHDVLPVHRAREGLVLHLFLDGGHVHFEDAAVRLYVRDGGDETGQFVASVESLFERRHTRHTGMTGVRENSAADLLGHAALGEDRLTLLRMLVERRVNLPIEVVQQSRDGPFPDVFAEFGGVGGHAGLDRKRVLAETLGLGEFAEKVPGLVAGEHR